MPFLPFLRLSHVCLFFDCASRSPENVLFLTSVQERIPRSGHSFLSLLHSSRAVDVATASTRMSSTRLEQLATWLSTTGASIVDALPVPNARTRITFALSCAFLCALYVFAVRVRGYDAPFPPQKDALKLDGEAVRQWRKQQAKLRSWILTGFSALVMTLGSLPYLVDLVLAKGDVARVARRESLSQALSTFFVAYLCCVCRPFYAAFTTYELNE